MKPEAPGPRFLSLPPGFKRKRTSTTDIHQPFSCNPTQSKIPPGNSAYGTVATMAGISDRWPTSLVKMSERRTPEQIRFLVNHIDEGINLIKEGKFEDSIEHFTSETAARDSGIKLIIERTECEECLSFVDLYEGFYTDDCSGGYRPGYWDDDKLILKYVCCRNLSKAAEQIDSLNQQRRVIAYMMLEEWLHSAQDGFGTALSKTVREIIEDDLKIKYKVDDDIAMWDSIDHAIESHAEEAKTVEDVITILESKFNVRVPRDYVLNPFSERKMSKLSYSDLMELDIALFYIENDISFTGNTLHAHPIRELFLGKGK